MSKILDLLLRVRSETAGLDDVGGKLKDIQGTTQELGTDAGAWGEETKDAVEGLHVPTRALSQLLRAVGADGAASFVQIAGNARETLPVLKAVGEQLGLIKASLGATLLELGPLAIGFGLLAAAIAGANEEAKEHNVHSAEFVTDVERRAAAMGQEQKAVEDATKAVSIYIGYLDKMKTTAAEAAEAIKRITSATYLQKAAEEIIAGNALQAQYWLHQAANAKDYEDQLERTLTMLKNFEGLTVTSEMLLQINQVVTGGGGGGSSGGVGDGGTISVGGQTYHDAQWIGGYLYVRGQNTGIPHP